MALRSSETSFTRVAHPIGAEHHRSQRAPWLRAAVLGANDGILSTSALVIGVAAANTGRNDVIIAGVAAIVAGALSMAVGEYVSVSSQRDAERADLDIEAEALRANPRGELHELARIYQDRGVEPGLARLVAEQLMARDELGAHARDELGFTDLATAKPRQAAWTSAVAFTAGAIWPVLAVLSPRRSGSRPSPSSRSSRSRCSARSARPSAVHRVAARPLRTLVLSSAALLISYGIGHAVGNIV